MFQDGGDGDRFQDELRALARLGLSEGSAHRSATKKERPATQASATQTWQNCRDGPCTSPELCNKKGGSFLEATPCEAQAHELLGLRSPLWRQPPAAPWEQGPALDGPEKKPLIERERDLRLENCELFGWRTSSGTAGSARRPRPGRERASWASFSSRPLGGGFFGPFRRRRRGSPTW